MTVSNVSFGLFFRWFDLWVGLYVDVRGRSFYFCPLPTIGVKVSW